MVKNKKGFLLPYVTFLLILALNIFIYAVLYYLNTISYYQDKDKYYQVFVMEERAKGHIRNRFTFDIPLDNEIEYLYYEDNYIYLRYDMIDNNYWQIYFLIYYDGTEQMGYFYFNQETEKLNIYIQ